MHQNHYLFSDHYLDNILPTFPVWKEEDGLEESFEEIRKVYLKQRETIARTNEAQLEKDFVQPILEILEHCPEVQTGVHLKDHFYRIDYTFFSSDADRLEARKRKGKKEFFDKAIGIGDAKYWDRPLDKKIKGRGDPFDNSNPNYQIDTYLRAADKKWGLLTNGRLWRLYNRDTSFSMDSFYQVDLVQLIQQGDLEAFKYFYLFFRRQAFERFEEKPTFLDFVYDESSSYTVGVQKDLKERVYEALRILANGFLHYPGNNLDPIKDRQEIHDNCLILLYRLLFVFYAEVRGLLPTDNPDYQSSFSFDRLKKEIHDRKRRGESISPVTFDYWSKLKALFMLINEGYDQYDIPQYNGGLFDPQKHPFLENHTIGDQAMADAFQCLACTPSKDGLAFVDYRDLGVQHLGSIYEGLLEYKLQYAEEDKVVVRDRKKRQLVESAADHPDLPVAFKKGEYCPVTDKGERKATGSYYTPDYIVRYIVENTLQPVVDRCETYKDILELNVLDPAMGSGHFLVGVVDFLAEQIVYHPTTPLLEEGDEEKEIAHWRRRVVERCVYGVDINPLAVELAKLSLWLHTVSYGKPLSFLDHHLRCGNSLIGARVKDLDELPDVKKKKKKIPEELGKQITIFENRFLQQVSLAVKYMMDIELAETHTKRHIEEKESYFKAAVDHLQHFREVANVWVSAYFGNGLTKGDYDRVMEALQANRLSEVKELPYYQKAQNIADEKGFFHWEMEFPDVFFDRHGRWLDNPGFDGVVGNPPYVTLGIEDRIEQNYFRIKFIGAVYKVNTYLILLENALGLISNRHRVGLIIPNSILSNAFLADFRKFVISSYNISNIVDISNKVFPEAEMGGTVIIIIERTEKVDGENKIKL
ncbi:MAG: Eco57I restriction-modification methylase domain-containing protein, partial [bacterium]